MYVEDAVGRASAVIATRVGEAYLRTTRDRRVTDNIGELPVLDELPDVTGIGLSCQDLGTGCHGFAANSGSVRAILLTAAEAADLARGRRVPVTPPRPA